MVLTDLKPGTPIFFEVSIGDSSYEIPSSVISTKQDFILIDPIKHHDNVVEMNEKKGMLFSIYAIDPSTEGRVVWKNVHIETIEYLNVDFKSSYYKIYTNGFSSRATESERRNTKRIQLDIHGTIMCDDDTLGKSVTIHDVSDNGISFITIGDYEIESNHCMVNFNDEVNGRVFSLQARAIIVRSTKQGLQTFYGCSIASPNRDFLTYVFLKRLGIKLELQKANQEKAAKEAEENLKAASEASDANQSNLATSGFRFYNK